MADPADDAAPPEPGWRPLGQEAGAASGFIAANGPLWWRRRGGALAMGFRVAPRHCNPIGTCHGGMLLTLADVAIGFGIAFAAGYEGFPPTVSLTGDFLAPAPLGAWVDGTVEVHRVTGGTGFASIVLAAGAAGPVLRASGAFKLPRAALPGFALHRLFPED